MTEYTTTMTQDARRTLAEAVAKVADNETLLVIGEYDLDPIEDAVLIAQIAEGDRLKKEEGRLKRQREKINAAVREGIESKRHTILTVGGEPVVEMQTGVQKTEYDYDLMERLAPVAFNKSRTVTHDGTRLTYL